MRQGMPFLGLSCNPPPRVVCHGATREPMACPGDICFSYFLTSSRGQWPLRRVGESFTMKPKGPAVPYVVSVPHDNLPKNCVNIPSVYPACCFCALDNPVPISARTRPSGIDSYPRYMTRYRLKQGIRVTAATVLQSHLSQLPHLS